MGENKTIGTKRKVRNFPIPNARPALLRFACSWCGLRPLWGFQWPAAAALGDPSAVTALGLPAVEAWPRNSPNLVTKTLESFVLFVV